MFASSAGKKSTSKSKYSSNAAGIGYHNEHSNVLQTNAKNQLINTSKELAQRNLDVSPSALHQAVIGSSVNRSPIGMAFENQLNGASPAKRGVDRAAGIAQVFGSIIDYEDGELCKTHKGQLIVAKERESDVYGCDKCVFDRMLKKPMFLTGRAKKIKTQLDVRQNDLLKNLQEMEDLQPDTFQIKVQKQVSEYFSSIYEQVRSIEREVIASIKSSTNLQALKEALSALHSQLNNREMDKLEEEKRLLDTRIETQRFAYIVQRDDHYAKVQADYDRVNEFLNEKVSGAKQFARDLLTIEYKSSNLYSKVFEMIQSNVSVDKKQLMPKSRAEVVQPATTVKAFPFFSKSATKHVDREEESKAPHVSAFQTPEQIDAPAPINTATQQEAQAFVIKPDVEQPVVEQPVVEQPAASFGQVSPDVVNPESASPAQAEKKSPEDQKTSVNDPKQKEESKSEQGIPEDEQMKSSPVDEIDNAVMEQQSGDDQVAQASAAETLKSLANESQLEGRPTRHFYTNDLKKQRNKIVKRSFTSKQTEIVATVSFCEKPKIVCTPLKNGKQRVFVVGGGSVNGELVVGNVAEVNTKLGQLIPKAPMQFPRIAAGCCVDASAETIYSIGGCTEKQTASKKCEVYSIEENKWSEWPDLPEALYSLSACIFNDEYLFTVGGINAKGSTVKTIQRLNLEDPHTTLWDTLDVKMGTPLSNVGLYQIKTNQIIIFGGWAKGVKTAQVHILQEQSNGTFSLRTKKNNTGDLKNADAFIINGVARHDDGKKEIIFAGMDYIHKFHETSHVFDQGRKLEQ